MGIKRINCEGVGDNNGFFECSVSLVPNEDKENSMDEDVASWRENYKQELMNTKSGLLELINDHELFISANGYDHLEWLLAKVVHEITRNRCVTLATQQELTRLVEKKAEDAASYKYD